MAAALWMSCTPAQALKAVGWFLSIEKGVTFDKIQFVLLPVILWLMHNKRLGEIFASYPLRFRHSSLILSIMNAVSIFIVIAAIPRTVGGGVPALAFAVGNIGFYDIGERIYWCSMDSTGDQLGRSVAWYRGSMDEGRLATPHELAVFAKVYGSSSKQMAAVTPDLFAD
ncbi:MAG: hypothetical protein J0H83_05730 [Candidatus Melainabacteria bacterium]|nr:hypothetical protein [Candidatus Melainabacteria bacterium]